MYVEVVGVLYECHLMLFGKLVPPAKEERMYICMYIHIMRIS